MAAARTTRARKVFLPRLPGSGLSALGGTGRPFAHGNSLPPRGQGGPREERGPVRVAAQARRGARRESPPGPIGGGGRGACRESGQGRRAAPRAPRCMVGKRRRRRRPAGAGAAGGSGVRGARRDPARPWGTRDGEEEEEQVGAARGREGNGERGNEGREAPRGSPSALGGGSPCGAEGPGTPRSRLFLGSPTPRGPDRPFSRPRPSPELPPGSPGQERRSLPRERRGGLGSLPLPSLPPPSTNPFWGGGGGAPRVIVGGGNRPVLQRRSLDGAPPLLPWGLPPPGDLIVFVGRGPPLSLPLSLLIRLAAAP